MLRISSNAKNKILSLRAAEEKAISGSFYLRILVKSGGCSGLVYEMDFVDRPKEGDHAYEVDGVHVAVDKPSVMYLMGVTLDFSDGLNGKGFHFINPKATRTCGCGESFAL